MNREIGFSFSSCGSPISTPGKKKRLVLSEDKVVTSSLDYITLRQPLEERK
jgi:hypothetical protein